MRTCSVNVIDKGAFAKFTRSVRSLAFMIVNARPASERSQRQASHIDVAKVCTQPTRTFRRRIVETRARCGPRLRCAGRIPSPNLRQHRVECGFLQGAQQKYTKKRKKKQLEARSSPPSGATPGPPPLSSSQWTKGAPLVEGRVL